PRRRDLHRGVPGVRDAAVQLLVRGPARAEGGGLPGGQQLAGGRPGGAHARPTPAETVAAGGTAAATVGRMSGERLPEVPADRMRGGLPGAGRGARAPVPGTAPHREIPGGDADDDDDV